MQAWGTAKTRDQTRVLVNSLIPKTVSYAVRIDATQADSHMERVVCKATSHENNDNNTSYTLTELEALWGEARVQRGLDRKDIVVVDGMYQVRRSTESHTRATKDKVKVSSKAHVDGRDAEQLQDGEFDFISFRIFLLPLR